MIEIKSVDNLGEIDIVKRKTNKKQILLFDTKRKVNHYISKLKYRKITNYNEVPHYIIDKNGIIYEIFKPEYYSKLFDNDVDKKQIKIALENLSWLMINPLNGTNINWIGDKTRLKPYIKRWKGHYYWDNYTDAQMDSLQKLTEQLTEKFNIPNRKFGTNNYFAMASDFEGILYKSNFSDIYMDINPSFKFD